MTFDEFIMRENASDATAHHKKANMLKTWFSGLDDLYAQVKSFLSEYINDGKVKISESEITITENFLGKYTVKKMTIHLGSNGKEVEIVPIAADALLCHGRVEIKGLLGTVKLVLVNSKLDAPALNVEDLSGDSLAWKLVTPPAHVSYIPLTKDFFLDLLLRITVMQ